MADPWFATLAHLRERRHEFNAAELCARFLLLHLFKRHDRQWLSGPRAPQLGRAQGEGQLHEILNELGFDLLPRQRQKLSNLNTVRDLFENFFFRGVVLDSHEGFVAWLEDRYPLILRFDLPTPTEMLEAQCAGRRFVSLLLADEAQFIPYDRHADACAFMLHDLEHAHKFFGNAKSFAGQIRLFNNLRATLRFFEPWQGDSQFCRELNYLKSDMNSHPLHLLKYLKAITLTAEIRKNGKPQPAMENFWRELFAAWQMPKELAKAALRINHPELETPADQIAVEHFFCGRNFACGALPLEAR